MKLLISRSTESEGWELDTILTHIEKEIEARERANTVNPSNLKKPPRENPTAVSLVASNPETLSCCYCRQPHPTKGCTNVVQVGARKEILRKSGRCYVCLKRGHVSRVCRSRWKCEICNGRHHSTICEVDKPGYPRNQRIHTE